MKTYVIAWRSAATLGNQSANAAEPKETVHSTRGLNR